MFTRAGASGGVVCRERSLTLSFVKSLTDFVKQLSGVLSPTSSNQVQAPQNQIKVVPIVTNSYSKRSQQFNSLSTNDAVWRHEINVLI